MKKVVYAVVESNFQYNDEYYEKAGQLPPVEAYYSREKALAVALLKTHVFLNEDENRYVGAPFDVVEITIEDSTE